jgi:integrase
MSESSQKARRTRVPGPLNTGVYKTADGHLEIGWKDASGRQRWRIMDPGTTIPQARAAFGAERAKAAKGEKTADKPRMTFAHAAEAWWETAHAALRPTTREKYRSHLDAHLLPAFGSKRLTSVTADDVARYVARKTEAGAAGSSVRSHLSVLSMIFTYAIRRLGHAGSDPVAGLERRERPKIKSDDETAHRILDGAELTRLLSTVEPRYRLIFEVAAETGARLSEALGLAWGNIDTREATITFTHQLERSTRKRVALKTPRSRRTVEVTPGLVAKLREAKAAAVKSTAHDLVFVTTAGSGHDHRNIGGRVMARAVTRAGLHPVVHDGVVVEAAPTFHDLRHSHASALIAAGLDVEQVSARLGHADVAITMRTYIHEFDKSRRSDAVRGKLATLYGVETILEAEGRATAAEDSNVRALPSVGRAV